MGVGSGLGTFRGTTGASWPLIAKHDMTYIEVCNPKWFRSDPKFGWAFWHHGYNSFTKAVPHEGYHILKEIAASKPHGGFSVTSNVDGHWLEVGFDPKKVYEVHGAIRFMQCVEQLCNKEEDTLDDIDDDNLPPGIWRADPTEIAKIKINTETGLVTEDSELPKCAKCGGLSRPNVFMFGDWGYKRDRVLRQQVQYNNWIHQMRMNKVPLVVVEVGAGVVIPTIREESHKIIKMHHQHGIDATLIRINPVHHDVSMLTTGNHISIPMNAEDALVQIKQKMLEIKGGM
eukprot:TRINITY_DN13085_c0_g1_i1.p1 TRINITY_DN13085_c0_g1~~TRINITY_DN13085_c0_g1_i1.p1  ORF type:complete len:287 (+),score=51.18 TRINITY_DN13085_c0_g1_i1:3-863(+)